MRVVLPVFLCLASACSAPLKTEQADVDGLLGSDDAGTTGENGSDSGPDDSSPDGTSPDDDEKDGAVEVVDPKNPDNNDGGLADLKATMDRSAEGCQDIDGLAHPGAASQFYGELELVDTDDVLAWRGFEEWILVANDAWQDTGVDDCTVTWSLRAEETDAGVCAACDLSIAVVASIDESRTSCPADLWEEHIHYAVEYDVLVDPDTDDTRWFFASSGNMLGAGSHADGALNYLTDRTCLWF